MRKIMLLALPLCGFVTAPLLAQSNSASKPRIVCWTDDAGRRMCGDRVPPQYVKKERQVLNERGVVVETKSRQKTAEELAAEERARQLARELEERREEQARYDRFLLETYRTVADLEATRDDRVTTLDARIRLGEKAIVDGEAALQSLNEQIENVRKSGKEPAPKLLKQVKEFERGLAENRRAVDVLKQEREQIVAKFAEDIARYRELRPGGAR